MAVPSIAPPLISTVVISAAGAVSMDGALIVDSTVSGSGNFSVGGTLTAAGKLLPLADDAYDLGASGTQFKDLYLDGVAYIDDLRADALGAAMNCASQAMTNINVDSGAIDGVTMGMNSAITQLTASNALFTSAVFPSINVNGGEIDGTPIGANVASTAAFTTLSTTGDVDLGNTTSDTITATGRFDSDLIPSGSARDLGANDRQWAELHCDTGYIDAITVTGTSTLTTVDINGGAIDGTNIGAASAASGSFTTMSATGDVDLGNATTDTITATGRFDSHLVPSSDSARDLGTSALQWSQLHCDTGYIDAITVTGTSTLTTVDINGGAVDGTAIGANSTSTGQFTTVSGSGNFSVGGSLIVGGGSVVDGNSNPVINFDQAGNVAIVNSVIVGGGYGSTGLTLGADGTLSLNGALTAASSAQIAGGFGSSGVDISAAGAVSMDGALIVDSTVSGSGNFSVGGTLISTAAITGTSYKGTVAKAITAYATAVGASSTSEEPKPPAI